MLPDSKRRIFCPSVKVSVKAGMRPLGLISRNHLVWLEGGWFWFRGVGSVRLFLDVLAHVYFFDLVWESIIC